jgi:hypothetical protein
MPPLGGRVAAALGVGDGDARGASGGRGGSIRGRGDATAVDVAAGVGSGDAALGVASG